MQSTLIMMIHAQLCSRRDVLRGHDASADSDLEKRPPSTCKYSNCQMIKNVLRHMRLCRLGTDCKTPLCVECHQLVAHFNKCVNLECPVCKNIRRIAWRQRENQYCAKSCEVIQHYKQCALINCSCCKYMHQLKPTRTRLAERDAPKREVLLAHACRCQDRSCRQPMCIKIRRVISHTKVCNGKTNNSAICREVFSFCCQHAIVCRDANCVITDSYSLVT